MAEKKEEVKPFAPTTHRTIDINNPDDFPAEFRHHKCIKCGGCSAAVVLILLVTVLILMLTILHVKDPLLTLNSVKINGVDSLSGDSSAGRNNLTLMEEFSLENPNAASFKFDNVTSYVYYGGLVVGKVMIGPGRVGPRRTIRVGILVDVMVDKVVEVESFGGHLSKGVLGIKTYTSVNGKVKITNVSKRSFVVEMNCSMNVNVSRKEIEFDDRSCETSIIHIYDD